MPSKAKNKDTVVQKITKMANSKSDTTRLKASELLYARMEAQDFETIKTVPTASLIKLATDPSTEVRMQTVFNWMVLELLPKEVIIKLLSDKDSIIKNTVLDSHSATKKLSDDELSKAANAFICEYKKNGFVENTGFRQFLNPDLDRLPKGTLEAMHAIRHRSDFLATLKILRRMNGGTPELDKRIEELARKPN
jgi:hypothetical protein